MNYEIEISKLDQMLTEAGIEHEYKDLHGGKQVIVWLNDDDRVDAVCHCFSYGNSTGLLEIMGGLTKEELEDDNVLGWLTAEQVFKRFEYCYNHKTTVYKEEWER